MVKPKEDLTNQIFKNIKVIKQTNDYQRPSGGRPRAQWLCQCTKCGQKMTKTTSQLKSKQIPKCKCPRPKQNHKPSIVPKMTFGELTAIKRVQDHYTPSGIKKPQWLCECSCGNQIVVQQQRLKLNEKTHCGCLKGQNKKKQLTKENTYDLTGEFGIGYTNAGEPFWFDLEDYDKIKDFCWRYDKRGYVTTTAPKDSNLPKTPKLHNIIMQPPKGMIVDHKQHPDVLNGHKYDNRKENLRFVTISQNRQNSQLRQDNEYGHTGISKRKNTWIAQITKDKKTYRKSFSLDQLGEACKWRDEMEIKLFGEYRFKHNNP